MIDEVAEQAPKGGLDNLNSKLHKTEESLTKTLTSLDYVKEPSPSGDQDTESKASIEGTMTSLNYTADRLTRLAESLAKTVSTIRHG